MGVDMEYSILLNFIPLKNQEFTYIIYRKENKGEAKNSIDSDIYSNTLPINVNNLDDRKKYWISFIQKNGFEEFICKPEYNNQLTLHYLYYCLIERIKTLPFIDKFIIPNNKFRKMLFFVLKQHQIGKECLLFSPYYLPSEKKFGFIIDFKFLKNKDVPFNREVQRLSLSLDKNFKSNSNFYIDKFEKLAQFRTYFYSNIFPLKINHENIELEDNFFEIKADTLKTKIYIVGNSQETNSQFIGIRDYGPFKPLERKITLMFFYKSEHISFASDLAKALQGEMFNTFNGINNFFRINDIDFRGYEVKGDDENQEILNSIAKNRNEAFIPIIIISKNEEDRYYQLKHQALKNYNHPIQFVTIELLKNKDSLKWSISNIALQIFAKLGGIPWLIKPETQKTLIIGIGQSHERQKNEYGKYKIIRYFAYSVLTDSSGRFKELKTIGKFDNEKNYLASLSEHLKDTLKKYTGEFNNFIIHCPFKITRFELEKIKTTIQQLNSKKTFVVIKINTDNKFFGFNSSLNSLVPYESTYVQLSSNEFLIWFEGLQYHNPNINKRLSGPSHIEFWYSNNNLSLGEKKAFMQDILNLSGANWRGFNAKSSPISIHYTRLVSKFIQHFSKYDEINFENIEPWFL